MERKGDADDAVGDEDAEVFADLGASHQVLPGERRDDEERMKEHCAEQSLSDGCFGYSGASDKKCGHREGSYLDVRAVHLHVADVLEEDELPPCGKNRGENDGDDAHSVDLDPGDFGNMPVLSHGAKILSELRLEEKKDPDAEESDDHQRQYGNIDVVQVFEHRYVYAPGAEDVKLIDGVLPDLQIERVDETDAGRKEQPLI